MPHYENQSEKEELYSMVDERMYYRSTINTIPSQISQIRASQVPFMINVILENYEGEDVPLCDGEIVRCDTCKSYLNPHAEIIPPGVKWRCNICLSVNTAAVPLQVASRGPLQSNSTFSASANRCHNYTNYSRAELLSTVYDLVAPPSYSIKTPSPPTFCFLIEATFDSMKHGALMSVVRSISSGLNYSSWDLRSRMMFAFFDSSVYLLRKTGGFFIVPDPAQIPFLLLDDVLLPLSVPIDPGSIEGFFAENKSIKSNYGDALKIVQSVLSTRGGCILSFMSTYPNAGTGAVEPNPTDFRCKSVFYKEAAASLAKQSISVSHFLFPHLSIELPTLNVLSKYTGGMVYYYPNFDGEDPVFSTKLMGDIASHLELNLGLDGACRVRASKNVFVKEFHGSLHQRSADLLAFPAFFPPHSFSFEIELYDEVEADAVSLQVAIIRTIKSGERRIRVINFSFPKAAQSFYDFMDPCAVAHAFALKSFYYEAQKKGSGSEFVTSSLKTICRSYMEHSNTSSLLPSSIESLPVLMLALCKSIPLRPLSYTPMDYKAYYIYLMTNAYPKLVDTIIYPTLIALHKLDNIQPLNLSLNCLETSGLYLLDTGVNIFFFVGRDCDSTLPDLLFDPAVESDRFIFDPEENEFSRAVCNIMTNIRQNRHLTPNYILVRDDGSKSLYRDIFFTYFIEDECFGLPSVLKYLESLKREQ
jgi:protein transport protein SEC24